MKLIVGGIDPSFRNQGLAKAVYDTETNTFEVTEISLQQTELQAGKTVRKSSDDLRCANVLVKATHDFIADCSVVFAEIPAGAQSARAAFTLGIAVGVLGSVGPVGHFNGRLIQVSAADVKRLSVGSKNAAKHEIIEWAEAHWPSLPWPRKTRNPGKGNIDEARAEHMADACAAINAGIQTDEFKSIIQIVRSAQDFSKSQ